MKFTNVALMLAIAQSTLSQGEAAICASGEGRNGHFYEVVKYQKGTVTWHTAKTNAEAMTHCEKKGHLVTLTSQDESDFILGLIKDASCGTDRDTWIGLRDDRKEGTFEWVTGETYNWHNWCPGQPDNGGNEDYGEIWIDQAHNGCWNDNQADLRGSANGADNDKYVVEYDCIPARRGGSNGDPHFKTWAGGKYDFHGACDLVLLDNKSFENGKGMTIQIRTKMNTSWSFIESAVLRIGNSTLELRGGKDGGAKYWIDGEDKTDSLKDGDTFLISGFQTKMRVINANMMRFSIDLGHGDMVSLENFKTFVAVNAHAKSDRFMGSLGLMGSFPEGKKVARNGTTILEDADAFGQEWQVLSSEPMLFHKAEGVQHPEKCTMPDMTTKKSRRRLGEVIITEEEASIACTHANQDDVDACIFDVLATNDKEMAGAY